MDLTIFKDYHRPLDKFDTNYVDEYIEVHSFDEFLESQLHTLDCTIQWPNGIRVMQTINYSYHSQLSKTIYGIDNYCPAEEKDNAFNKLIERHKLNLEYEQKVGTITYEKVTFNKKTKTTKKQPKEKKEKSGPSAAERKASAKIAKLSALNFNIKITK